MILRALALFVCLGFGGAAFAQTITDVGVENAPDEVVVSTSALQFDGINLADWTSFAATAEGIVETGTASTFALNRLRGEMVPWRDAFLRAQGTNDDRLRTVESQIAAFGTLAEGAEWPVEIAARLEELTVLKDRLSQPKLLASEAHARADGLVGEIDGQLGALETKQFFTRSSSPANPGNWPKAISDIVGAQAAVFTEFTANFKVFATDGTIWLRLTRALAALILATAFVFWSRTRLYQLADKNIGTTPSRQVLIRFAISVVRIFLPILGLSGLVAILTLSGFFGLSGLALMLILPIAGGLIFYAKWLRDGYFPQGFDKSSILGYDQKTCKRGGRATVLLGCILAASVAVDALMSTTRALTVSLDVINMPIQLLIGILMWRIGAAIVALPAPESVTFYRRGHVRQLVGRTTQCLGVAGPFASVLGYGTAAASITIPAVVSLAILATVVALHRLVLEMASHAPRDGADTETDGTVDPTSGLWPIVINGIIVLLSVPVFLLVWGETTSDMIDVWTQFLAGFKIGDTQISPSSFLTFISVFVLGYLLTGVIKSSLKTSVLPRTRLDLGGQNAVIAGAGYTGIFLSALIAFSVAGIDLSSLAIVAGALSVGIGFGLQNIVSNFVSGIILLIERPIGEGDMIEVGGQMGYVRDISVRSTRIETFDRTDVIVPNADLVSGQVTNWTRGNAVGRAIVAVGVAYGSNTTRVTEILQEIAEANPMVLMNPQPSVLLMRFGADSIDFEIRAIIRDVNYVNVVKSEMFHEILKRFGAEDIEIPFAQRDIWLRNPEVLHPKGDAS